ncbi:MAG: hypothetical protein RLZZ432_557 [Chloroflexota bacterium]
MPSRAATAPRRVATRAAIGDLTLAAALWGGLYIVSAAAFAAVPPATLTLLRLALGAGALLLVGRLRGEASGWGLAPRRATLAAAAVAALSMLLQFGGTALTSGVEGSVVTMSTPVFVLLFGRLLEGERIALRAWLGIGLAAAGVLLLAARATEATGAGDGAAHLVGVVALVGAGATWALFSSLGRPLVAQIGARRAIALSGALALPFIVPFAAAELLLVGIDLAAATTPASIGAILYLGLGATALGWSAWYRGYAAAPPRVSAGVLFLQPLVSALLGIGVLGAPVDAAFAVGSLLLLGGVAAIARVAP